MLSTNAYLWLTYLLSLGAFLRHPRERRLLVRYEAFAEDPDGVLAEFLERVGSAAAPPDLSALDTGVAFQGNSLLRNESVAFERQPERPSPGSRLTALLNAPWGLVFSRLGRAAGAGPGGSELPVRGPPHEREPPRRCGRRTSRRGPTKARST